ncbi:MAG: FkbM family methyltransferase [Candidatus Melainabacteria bacterium]|nr:FkbM family methyltransferase [Candidatus Melainabacteria bacterium]
MENIYELDLIARFMPKNPVIFEAGAYGGSDTLLFAQRWPDATIISFEASPTTFNTFSMLTAGVPNIRGYNLAVSTYNGKAKFYLSDNDVGSSSLLPSHDNQFKEGYKGPEIIIDCVILDDWCSMNSVDHIDFMWLDLEGMELQVLRSSPKILSSVKVIYTETNFQEFRKGMTQYNELKTFLEKSGFKLLAHRYLENWQGNAIFINDSLTAN